MINLTIKQILRLSQVAQPLVIDPWKSAVGYTLMFNPGYFSDASLALQSVNKINDILIDGHSDFPISEFTKNEHRFDVLRCILANLYMEKDINPRLFEALFYPLAKVYLLGFEANQSWATGWIKAHLSLDPNNTRLSGLFSAMKAVNQDAPYILHIINSHERIESTPEVTDFDAAIKPIIEADNQQRQKMFVLLYETAKPVTKRARHHNSIFASNEKDAYISAKEMANSPFGKKRPKEHDDVLDGYNPTIRKHKK